MFIRTPSRPVETLSIRSFGLPRRFSFTFLRRSSSRPMSTCSFALHGSIAICWRTPRHAEKLRLGGIALDYAQKAAALAPANAEAQLVAISYGKMLLLHGHQVSIPGFPRNKAYAEKAIQLDPDNDLAWHVLGRWHRTLSDVNMLKRTVASFMYGQLPKTTTEKAVSCFEKALEINPRRLMHYVELGRAYAQMGKTEEARRLSRRVSRCQIPKKTIRRPSVEVRTRWRSFSDRPVMAARASERRKAPSRSAYPQDCHR